MKKLPEVNTQEYYDLISYVCALMENYMFMDVYGFTNYDLAFHWGDKDINTYGSNKPQSIHIKTAIKLLDKIGVAGKLTEYIYEM